MSNEINKDELKAEIVQELTDNRFLGNKLLLSRREAIALSTGVLGLGAFGLSTGTVDAQSGGGFGTPDNRMEIYGDLIDTNTLEAAEATIGNTTFESDTVSLSDDSATTIAVAKDQIIWVLADSNNATGNFLSTFGQIDTIKTGDKLTNQGGGTTLSGTTGPDGSVNVSREGNDLNVENRLGSSTEVDILRLNR